MKVKVLSYNIHKGLSPFNRKSVLARIRSALGSEGLNFVFLQEVIGGSNEAHEAETVAQFKYLAQSNYMHFIYGRNGSSKRGHHGNAILSTMPIVEWENIDISTNRLERRGLLHGICEDLKTKQRFDLMCIHLDLSEAGRQKQLEKICQRIDAANDKSTPLLVCGDFNDWRQQATPKLAEIAGVREALSMTHGSHAKTFPSFMPVLPLDRIYFRQLELEKAKVLSSYPWRGLSDHLPVIAHFKTESTRLRSVAVHILRSVRIIQGMITV